MTLTKRLLSASIQGKAIKVVATSTPGTTIHTAVAGTTSLDEIWLYAENTSGVDVNLTIEWGETSVPDGNIVITVQAYAGLTLIIPGLLLQNELIVKAFASTANVITIHGYVNRIEV
jgi:hypothetical protein